MTFLKDKDKVPPSSKAVVTAKPASHDPNTPEALLAFMVKDWELSPTKLPPPVRGHTHFAARRKALSKQFPNTLLVIPTGTPKVRANDTHYRFRAGTDFYYLTGNTEPDCVLVLDPQTDGSHRALLFVEPNPGKTDATFFTDRVKGELWVGARLGVPESQTRFAVEEALPLQSLQPLLEGHKNKGTAFRILRGFSSELDQLLSRATNDSSEDPDKALATYLSEARLIKDELEIEELQGAIDATHRGFEDVIERLLIARSEREVEGVFYLRARTDGHDVGYGTIAACGAHACTLHWERNDGRVREGDLLLLDAGVESESLYTADITRVLPVSGHFTKWQRKVYELVLAAQAAAFREVKPGNDFLAPNRAAMRVLTEGLIKLGVLTTTLEEGLDEKNQFYRRYTLHNVSHMLGLDVHDCAQARAEAYRYGKLAVGMVLTVEPGLYFQPDDQTVPEHLRGIGVRIEDDVLVTKKGCKILSEHIPRDADDVEEWIARVWKRADPKKKGKKSEKKRGNKPEKKK